MSTSGYRRGAPEFDIQLLLIGKTGNGKSSTCNTIIGSNKFTTGRALSTTTQRVQIETFQSEEFSGSRIQVIDTPDVSALSMTEEKERSEVSYWKELAHSGPTAVLLIIRSDIRYTPEEFAIYQQIERLWGAHSLHKRLVVVFTFGDTLDQDIREELNNAGHELQKVLKNANNRFVVINNKNKDREPVEKLVDYARRPLNRESRCFEFCTFL